jgi:hypothetical protein
MLILELYPENRVGQRLDDRSLYWYALLFGHTAFRLHPAVVFVAEGYRVMIR